MQRTFVGTTSASVDLDPEEYRGLPVPRITQEIKAVMSSIKPDVDFYEEDMVLAAHEIALLNASNHANNTCSPWCGVCG